MDDNVIEHRNNKDWISLHRLSNNGGQFSIEQSIDALKATTTLTHLIVDFDEYEPTPENIRRVIEPLCHCISNLRLHNAQHPLRKLSFWNVNNFAIGEQDQQDGEFAQFLVAAKQFGIFHMDFSCVRYFPIQFLVEFCRDNNSLKVLDLTSVHFSSGAAVLPLPVNYGPPNNSVTLTLDKLTLYGVSFEGVSFEKSTAATVFANLVAHVNVSSLMLGFIAADEVEEDEDDDDDDDDIEIIARILSELKMPSAEQLTLRMNCRTGYFKAALDAGRTTVTDLNVDIDCGEDDVAARVELLASFIRRAVKLNSLTINSLTSRRRYFYRTRISIPPRLLQAMESCATATHIQVIRDNDLSADAVQQQFQKITSRNRELDRFATNPGTYPTAELPELMRQFDNCPTGRYMLAQRLPEIPPFAELYAMHLSRRRTNPPTPKKSKLH